MPRRQDERVDRRDVIHFLGFVVLLAAFFMLSPTARTAHCWWKSGTFARTEVKVISTPSRQGSMRVRVLSTGEEASVAREGARRPS
jgi:hypothetical protein